MSNYPPGVTGLEFEIAGPDWDGEMDVECGAWADLWVVSNDLARGLKDAVGSKDQALVNAAISWADTEPVPVQTQGTCPFAGEVVAWTYAGELFWNCPVCDTGHVQDLDELGDY